jgi:peptidoglycan/xylan/chitin deacetylase (PgdA/CDA1 family)
MTPPKKTVIFFDLEGWYETPYRGEFDVRASVESILGCLLNHRARAVFNTCGIIAELFPDLVKNIARHGHEIACHGYRHENFLHLTDSQIDSVLSIAEEHLYMACGEKPFGFRAPWLLCDDRAYRVLARRGYCWCSNLHAFHPEIYDRPDLRNNRSVFFRLLRSVYAGLRSYSMPMPSVRRKQGMLEVPLVSSMDGDLLSPMSPAQSTPEEWITYAVSAVKRQFHSAGGFFNLNFHTWIVGTQNRLRLLDETLHLIRSSAAAIVLPGEMAS